MPTMINQPSIRTIWNVVRVVKITMGLTFGLYLFTYGPYFYDKFGGDGSFRTAILLTSILLAVRQGLIALLEVPTGAVGDAVGRVNTVILSLTFRLLFFVGLAALALFNALPVTITIAVAVSIFFSLAYTFYSGTFTAWCVDSVRERAPDIGYEQILARGYTYEFVSQIFGAIIGIACYHFELSYLAFLLAAFVCLTCVVYCRGAMDEVKSIKFLNRNVLNISETAGRMREIISVGMRTCRRSTLIFWLILCFASYMFLVNVVDYLWPVYLTTTLSGNMQTPCWMGMAILIFVMCMAGSHTLTLLSARWKRRNGPETYNAALRRWFICGCFLSALPIVITGLLTKYGVNAFYGFIFAVLAVSYCYGLLAPCYEILLNKYIPDENSGERATIMSWGSMVKGLLVLALAIPAGGRSGAATIIGWVIPGLLLLFASIITNYYLKRGEAKYLEEKSRIKKPVEATDMI